YEYWDENAGRSQWIKACTSTSHIVRTHPGKSVVERQTLRKHEQITGGDKQGK
ncbi:hypothetical protein BgiBS90_036914, partial [Biomphalaria glabrata]